GKPASSPGWTSRRKRYPPRRSGSSSGMADPSRAMSRPLWPSTSSSIISTSRSREGELINGTLSLVVDAALDKKALDVAVLDLTELGSITDYFIVCHGLSSRQVQAIADRVEERLREIKLRPGHVEGYEAGEWILMDYVDFVVHIFTEEKREFYDLER